MKQPGTNTRRGSCQQCSRKIRISLALAIANLESSLRSPSLQQFIRRTGMSLTVICTLMGSLLFYGATALLLGWAPLLLAGAFMLRSKARSLSTFLVVTAIGLLLLWPIDASLKFPVLRFLNSSTPFGPEVSAHPSPSGKCTAYLYNFSFLDSAYKVRFAHGLDFPGDYHHIPLGEVADVKEMESIWIGGTFRVTVDGEVTFIYNAGNRSVTLPKVKPN